MLEFFRMYFQFPEKKIIFGRGHLLWKGLNTFAVHIGAKGVFWNLENSLGKKLDTFPHQVLKTQWKNVNWKVPPLKIGSCIYAYQWGNSVVSVSFAWFRTSRQFETASFIRILRIVIVFVIFFHNNFFNNSIWKTKKSVLTRIRTQDLLSKTAP